MVAVATSNYQHLQELETKLQKLKSHIVGRGPIRRYLEAKLRELEAERKLLERRSTRRSRSA
jgi:hypothetical protein